MNRNNNIIRIGNAQAFWGDLPQAPASLVKQQPDLDYLTLDYLAEVSMSIMAIQREKDPNTGYAQDFIDVVRSIIPFWQKGSYVKIVTNAGGLNPLGCAQACQVLLHKEQCRPIRIAVISGDDVFPILMSSKDPRLYYNLETKDPITTIQNRMVTANAYLGGQPIAEALLAGADIVITGRVADPSLTVGPCIAHFNWSEEDYQKIAGATVAGHLIECGTQVTGGISTNWLEMPDPVHIGYPIVEMFDDGSFIITKPERTGGRVTIETVKEQLLYEIGDPDKYLSPDATVSFLSLELKEVGRDRIKVSGAKGKAPPNTYKVSATYRDGYRTEGMLAIFGQDAPKKARRCGEIILERVRDAGYTLDRTHIECIGAGAVVPGVVPTESFSSLECMLRVAVAGQQKEALEFFTKQIAGIVTTGPQGVAGYTSGRPHVRPVFGYWPCLISRSEVCPKVQMLEVQ